MPKLPFLLALLLSLPAAATEVYRWVDASGQAHYSDQWQPGAEKLRIEESSRYSAVPPPARPAAGKAAPGADAVPYERLEIASPAHEAVLWNIGGQLRVAVQLQPALRSGHAIRLLMDGVAHDLPPGATETRLEEVYRGVHTLRAQVVDAGGKVLMESEPSTFMVQQTSIAAPGGG